MPTRSSNIHVLRQRVIDSSKRSSPHLVGSKLTEAGVLDRSVLNREIAEILEGVSTQADLAPRLERSIEAFLKTLHAGDVSRTAKHVCVMLSVELLDQPRRQFDFERHGCLQFSHQLGGFLWVVEHRHSPGSSEGGAALAECVGGIGLN